MKAPRFPGRKGRTRRRIAREEEEERLEAEAYQIGESRFAALCLVFLGIGVLAIGVSRTGRSGEVSMEPVPADLAALEAGEAPPGPHVRLGRHVALLSMSIPIIDRQLSRGRTPPDPRCRLDVVFYPILSPSHPYVKRHDRSDDPEPLPGEQVLPPTWAGLHNYWSLPAPREFAVLVRTDRYDSLGDIPKRVEEFGSIEGVALRRVSDRSWLVDRLREKFPDIDPSTVWVLDEGDEPNTPIELSAMIVFGVAAIGGGLYWCWRVFGARRPTP